MDLQKEREAFEEFYKTQILTKDYEIAVIDQLTEFHIETGLYEYARMQTAWQSWQAAKAHETKKLEGCLVVPVDQAKDTERLNFLLEDSPTRTICQHTHWSEDGELIAEGQCVAEIYYISGWDYIRESISETKRQAIDKAILEAARGGNE